MYKSKNYKLSSSKIIVESCTNLRFVLEYSTKELKEKELREKYSYKSIVVETIL